MKIETRSCVPIVPLMVTGVEGQELALVGIMQTVPVNCPWTGVAEGTRNRAPRSSSRDENNILVLVYFSPIFISR